MGNTASLNRSKVPMSVLISEISELNQGSSCEMSLCPHSCQDVSPGEFEHWKWRRCRKYSFKEHSKLFIPIKEFSIDHLPDSAKCPQLLEMVQKESLRTVRILVRYLSHNRPAKFMSGSPGSKSLSYGTGYASVLDYGDTRGQSLMITTAAHVVYDSSEAEHTTVEFFFNDDNDRSSIIKAKAGIVTSFEIDTDFCHFLCDCEDKREERQIVNKLNRIKFPGLQRNMLSNIAICISHPHGLAQKVSIGQVKEVVIEKEGERPIDQILKLLVGKCVYEIGINEKCVLYGFIKWYTTNLCLNHIQDIVQKNTIVEKVLKHLIHKGIIECPSERDEQMIDMLHELIEAICIKEKKEIFINRYGFDKLKNLDKGDFRLKSMEITSEIMERKLAAQIVPDGLDERCVLLFREHDSKFNEIRTGFIHSSEDRGIAKSIHYSVPTCPGTSGARIYAFKTENNDIMKFISPHSKGSKDYNSSGSGAFLIF